MQTNASSLFPLGGSDTWGRIPEQAGHIWRTIGSGGDCFLWSMTSSVHVWEGPARSTKACMSLSVAGDADQGLGSLEAQAPSHQSHYSESDLTKRLGEWGSQVA